MTQHRTYIGPHVEVELAATGQLVRRGQQVEIKPDWFNTDAAYEAFIEQLDEQPGNWAKPQTNAAKAVDEAPPAEDPGPAITFDGHEIDAPGEPVEVPPADPPAPPQHDDEGQGDNKPNEPKDGDA